MSKEDEFLDILIEIPTSLKKEIEEMHALVPKTLLNKMIVNRPIALTNAHTQTHYWGRVIEHESSTPFPQIRACLVSCKLEGEPTVVLAPTGVILPISESLLRDAEKALWDLPFEEADRRIRSCIRAAVDFNVN
jgi:hypothetical protein